MTEVEPQPQKIIRSARIRRPAGQRSSPKFQQFYEALQAAKNAPALSSTTATKARKDIYQLIAHVQDHDAVQITSKHGNAYLVSEDDWLSIKETLYLHSIPDVREAILEGMATPSEELAGEEALEW